jgi:hypothetical protein
VRAPLAIACLALAVSACAPRQTLSPAELKELQSQLLPAYQYNIGGIRYGVGRIPGQHDQFLIYTGGGEPGTQKAMARALRLAYGCQSMQLTEIEEPWRKAEARGTFCNGGQAPYGR